MAATQGEKSEADAWTRKPLVKYWNASGTVTITQPQAESDADSLLRWKLSLSSDDALWLANEIIKTVVSR